MDLCVHMKQYSSRMHVKHVGAKRMDKVPLHAKLHDFAHEHTHAHAHGTHAYRCAHAFFFRQSHLNLSMEHSLNVCECLYGLGSRQRNTKRYVR